MKVQLKRGMFIGPNWQKAGAVGELTDDRARELVRRGHAVQVADDAPPLFQQATHPSAEADGDPDSESGELHTRDTAPPARRSRKRKAE